MGMCEPAIKQCAQSWNSRKFGQAIHEGFRFTTDLGTKSCVTHNRNSSIWVAFPVPRRSVLDEQTRRSITVSNDSPRPPIRQRLDEFLLEIERAREIVWRVVLGRAGLGRTGPGRRERKQALAAMRGREPDESSREPNCPSRQIVSGSIEQCPSGAFPASHAA
jgi:hypothetical protein